MYNIIKICVPDSITVREALERIDTSGRHILLVIDGDKKLKGTITDGDIRRSLLKGINLNEPIKDIYNKTPRYCYEKDGRHGALKLMTEHSLDQIPVLSEEGVVVKLEIFNANFQGLKIPNQVIIMAGGLGTRLGSITNQIPKALTPIDDKPILEIIINRLINQGFRNFSLCVNHKKEMIQEYFKDGSRFNATISYVHEAKKLGTAGAISNIDSHSIRYPCVVTNCDILTTANFQDILEHHEKEFASITLGTRIISYDIPYGVLETHNDQVQKIHEKPFYEYQVNAGVYVLSKEIFDLVPKDTYFDMTDLIDCALSRGLKVSAYPLNGYWIDIGQLEDLEKARIDYKSLNL